MSYLDLVMRLVVCAVLASMAGWPLISHSFSLSDCVGEGGNKLCAAPIATSWVYGLCDNAGPYVSRYRAWCEVRGGTYVYITGPGCSGGSPHSESNIVTRSEDFADRMSPNTNCTTSDSGWGQTISSSQCWSGAPAYQNGLLIRDFRILDVSNCGEQIFARRDRQLVCPVGSTLYTIENLKVCVKDQEFDECPSVGNPILPMTGKKIQREADFSGMLPLDRIYSSESPFISYNFTGNFPQAAGQFGDYWRTNFSYRLFALNGNLSHYALTFPNGAVEYFASDLSPTTRLYRNGVLRSEGGDFIYRFRDLKLVFSAHGHLKRYKKLGQQEYTLHYSGIDFASPIPATLPDGRQSNSTLSDGLLMEIRNSDGEVVYKFSYDTAGRIVFIERASEKLFYEYDLNGNLVKVSEPDGSNRQYIYGNATFKNALTGIIDESGTRFAAWSYDGAGRAVSSAHSDGAEAVSLDFTHANNTADPRISVTNALGKQTTYYYGLYQGLRRVENIEGHASDNCAAANKSYSYYPNGTLKSKTDWSGNVTTYARDSQGREISRTEAAGTPQARTILTEYHPTLNVPVKISEPGMVTEMIYDSAGRLLQTKKSVVEQP
jgi:YD repeat-containing protein